MRWSDPTRNGTVKIALSFGLTYGIKFQLIKLTDCDPFRGIPSVPATPLPIFFSTRVALDERWSLLSKSLAFSLDIFVVRARRWATAATPLLLVVTCCVIERGRCPSTPLALSPTYTLLFLLQLVPLLCYSILFILLISHCSAITHCLLVLINGTPSQILGFSGIPKNIFLWLKFTISISNISLFPNSYTASCAALRRFLFKPADVLRVHKLQQSHTVHQQQMFEEINRHGVLAIL